MWVKYQKRLIQKIKQGVNMFKAYGSSGWIRTLKGHMPPETPSTLQMGEWLQEL